MKWISRHRRTWRAIILGLLLLAAAGPWTFDHVYVPAKYACSPPTIRLEGDFCGLRMSGLWILSFVIPAFIRMSIMVIKGQAILSEISGELLVSLVLSLLVLPFLSSVLLLLGETRRRVIFHLAALALGLGASVYFGLFKYPQQYWILWGRWLFTGVISVALIVEVLLLAAGGREFTNERNNTRKA